MDKPLVDAIEGIPPAIAIDQTNPVRTSRSTVGTMTELNDHLKLLFARAARLFCRGCGAPVRRDTPDTIHADLAARAGGAGDPRLVFTFPVAVPKNFSESEVKDLLQRQGYTRIHAQRDGLLEVIQDRFRMSSTERARVIEALEAALRVGQGRVNIYPLADGDGGHPSTATSDTTSQEIGHTMSAALRATGGQIPEQVRGASEGGRGTLWDLTPETRMGSALERRAIDRLHGRIPQAGPCSTFRRSLFRPSTRYLVTQSPLPPFVKGGRHEYVGGISSPVSRHSIRMPAAWITFAQVSRSRLMCSANPSGVLPIACAPTAAKRWARSGAFRLFTIS
jgi:hypothetical protein